MDALDDAGNGDPTLQSTSTDRQEEEAIPKVNSSTLNENEFPASFPVAVISNEDNNSSRKRNGDEMHAMNQDSEYDHLDKKKKENKSGDNDSGSEDLGGHDNQGLPLRLKLTRKGDAFSISKAGQSSWNQESSSQFRSNLGETETEGGERNSKSEKGQLPYSMSAPDGVNKPSLETLEVAEGEGIVISKSPLVVKQSVIHPHSSVLDTVTAMKNIENGESGEKKMMEGKISGTQVENISQSKASEVDASGIASTEKNENASKHEAVATSRKELQKMDLYRIPTHAAWFTWTKIHPIEMRSLPEFFNNQSASKTPKIYKDYRDFMINKYRENTKRPLNFTDVRRMLIGDVNTIRRVFEFLENWGLINFDAVVPESQSKKKALKWPGVSPLVEGPSQGSRFVSPQITPSTNLYKFESVQNSKSAASRSVAGSSVESASEFTFSTDLVSRKNQFGSAVSDSGVSSVMDELRGLTVEYHCDTCGADCSKRRYHCPKLADYDLCPKCFAVGKFNVGMSSSDFIRMDAILEVGEKNREEWSDQETLLLLEALEIYGDNWSEVAEHVATKTKAQCILHFIRLPIEDQFLDEMEHGGSICDPVLPRGAADSAHALIKSSAVDGHSLPNLSQQPKSAASSAAAMVTTSAPIVDVSKTEQATGSEGIKVGFSGGGSVVEDEMNVLKDKGRGEKEETENEKRISDVNFISEGNGYAEKQLAKEANHEIGVSEKYIPFADASNPVMAQVAFLAAMVGPRVAAAAAQAALQALTQEDSIAKAEIEAEISNKLASAGESQPFDTAPMASSTAPGPASASAGGFSGIGLSQEEKRRDKEEIYTEDPPSAVRMRAAAATALAAAAVKAKLMADQEEREIQRLVANIVENQMKKLELKLKHFDDLENMLLKEKSNIERQRQLLTAERVRLSSLKPVDSADKEKPVEHGHSQPVTQTPRAENMAAVPFQQNLSSFDLNSNLGLQNFRPHV